MLASRKSTLYRVNNFAVDTKKRNENPDPTRTRAVQRVLVSVSCVERLVQNIVHANKHNSNNQHVTEVLQSRKLERQRCVNVNVSISQLRQMSLNLRVVFTI